jgi:hypothetical protein
MTTLEGRPSTSRVGEDIQRVHDLVMSDHRITTRTILKEDLYMLKLCAKNHPKSFDSRAKIMT